MTSRKKARKGHGSAINSLTRSAPLALAAIAQAVFADPIDFTQSYFIGDSLSDSGYFTTVSPFSYLIPENRGRFTTYPGGNWTDYFAQYYGTSNKTRYPVLNNPDPGTNYANAGMGVAADTGNSRTGALNISQEVNQLIDDTEARTGSRQLDPNAIYSVWAGPGEMIPLLRQAATPDQLIARVPVQVQAIKTLQDVGARYIIVPNTSDVGLTPGFRRFGWSEEGTETSGRWSKALYQSLNEAGVHYIPDDARGGIQEIVQNPELFGIRNTTDPACGSLTFWAFSCGPESFVTPAAATTYMWSDWWHPTSGVYEMTARGIIANLEAPRLQQALIRSARNTGRNRADQVARHVTYSDFDGWRLWSALNGERGHNQNKNYYGSKTTPSGLIGLDYKKGHWVMGGFGGYGHLRSDFPDDWGDFDERDKTLGAFVGWYGENLWANLQASYSWLDYDIKRKLNFGPRTVAYGGSPDGKDITVSAQGGYLWHFENHISTGPLAAITWQKIEKDGYSESWDTAAHSYALDYRDDTEHSLIGRLGWELSYKAGWIEPYANVAYEHEFKDPDKEAKARLQTLPEAGFYRVPGLGDPQDSYTTATLGTRMTYAGFDLDIGITSMFDSDDTQYSSVFLNLSKRL